MFRRLLAGVARPARTTSLRLEALEDRLVPAATATPLAALVAQGFVADQPVMQGQSFPLSQAVVPVKTLPVTPGTIQPDGVPVPSMPVGSPAGYVSATLQVVTEPTTTWEYDQPANAIGLLKTITTTTTTDYSLTITLTGSKGLTPSGSINGIPINDHGQVNFTQTIVHMDVVDYWANGQQSWTSTTEEVSYDTLFTYSGDERFAPASWTRSDLLEIDGKARPSLSLYLVDNTPLSLSTTDRLAGPTLVTGMGDAGSAGSGLLPVDGKAPLTVASPPTQEIMDAAFTQNTFILPNRQLKPSDSLTDTSPPVQTKADDIQMEVLPL